VNTFYSDCSCVVCSTKCVVTARGEETSDHLIVLDENEDMSRVYEFDLQPLEQALSCGFFYFGGNIEYLVIGTAFQTPTDSSPTQGRLLVFQILPDKSLSLLTEKETKGSVLSIAQYGSRLVAGVGSKLQMFHLEVNEEPNPCVELLSDSACNGHVMSLMVRTRGDIILLGDLLCSASMFKYNEEESKIVEDSRDFSSHMLRTLEFIDDGIAIATDDCGNIFSLLREPGGDGEKGRLNICMEFHTGELSNVVKKGLLNSQPRDLGLDSSTIRESMVYGCVSGAIVTVVPINEDTFHVLSTLQKCLGSVVHGIGGLSRDEWRNFQNERRVGSQMNAVDGDIIETFLDMSKDQQEAVVRQVNFESQSSALSVTRSAERDRDMGINFRGDMSSSLTVSEVISRIEEISRLQ
jgi:DNA damage-binding protein 1